MQLLGMHHSHLLSAILMASFGCPSFVSIINKSMEIEGTKVRKGNGNGGGRIAGRGCVFVYVGEKEQHQERFVVPINHLHHPIFAELLRAAEEVFGFNHSSPLKIPCNVDHFKKLKRMIRKAQTGLSYFR